MHASRQRKSRGERGIVWVHMEANINAAMVGVRRAKTPQQHRQTEAINRQSDLKKMRCVSTPSRAKICQRTRTRKKKRTVPPTVACKADNDHHGCDSLKTRVLCGCGACSEERPMDATAAGTPRLSDQVFEFRVSRQKKFSCPDFGACAFFAAHHFKPLKQSRLVLQTFGAAAERPCWIRPAANRPLPSNASCLRMVARVAVRLSALQPLCRLSAGFCV